MQRVLVRGAAEHPTSKTRQTRFFGNHLSGHRKENTTRNCISSLKIQDKNSSSRTQVDAPPKDRLDSGMMKRRVLRDLADIHSDPLPSIEVALWLTDDDVVYSVSEGKEGTLFDGGVYCGKF